MTTRTPLAIAALAIALATTGISYLLIPGDKWTSATIASVVVLSLALASLLYFPRFVAGRSKTDGARIAALGPLGTTTLVAVILSALALVASLVVALTIAWSLLVLTVAAYVVGIALTHVTRQVVSDVEAIQEKDERYRVWTDALNQIALTTDDTDLKGHCNKIIEAFRYAPSARSSDATSEASLVSNAIAALRLSAERGDTKEGALTLRQLQAALGSHASALTALRSHA